MIYSEIDFPATFFANWQARSCERVSLACDESIGAGGGLEDYCDATGVQYVAVHISSGELPLQFVRFSAQLGAWGPRSAQPLMRSPHDSTFYDNAGV